MTDQEQTPHNPDEEPQIIQLTGKRPHWWQLRARWRKWRRLHRLRKNEKRSRAWDSWRHK